MHVQWAVRQTAEAENHMTSVERVLAYCNLPQERTEGERKGKGAPATAKGWPRSAALRFENVQVCKSRLVHASVPAVRAMYILLALNHQSLTPPIMRLSCLCTSFAGSLRMCFENVLLSILLCACAHIVSCRLHRMQ